jgi:hypothetical protein
MEGCGKMLFSKILIAYNGSELAQKALEKAIENYKIRVSPV